MSQLGTLEAGSRHDLRVGNSPDAPDENDVLEEADRHLRLCTFLRDVLAL